MLAGKDFVFIHIEAPDEAGHNGDYNQKIDSIEHLDERLIGRLLTKLNEEVVITFLTDHYTPVSVRKHTNDPVPFLIFSPPKVTS